MALNRIIKRLEIAVFLSVGLILTGTFLITPLLVVLLPFTNDFVTMSIATEPLVSSLLAIASVFLNVIDGLKVHVFRRSGVR